MFRSRFGSIAAGFAFLAASAAQAQSHIVIVNGHLLSDAEVMTLARMNCSEIPDGSYWLNMQTGAWGYAGNPTVQGRLGDGCRAGGPGGGVNQDGTIGPFATLRRAEEVANQYRAMGRRAGGFPNSHRDYLRVAPGLLRFRARPPGAGGGGGPTP